METQGGSHRADHGIHDLQSYPLDENFLIYSEKIGKLYILNSTGRHILELLKAGLTPSEAARRLTEEYGVPLETTHCDVETAVDEWRKIGLLHDGRNAVAPTVQPHQSKSTDITRYFQLPGLSFSIQYDREDMARQCYARLSAIEIPAPDTVDMELAVGYDGSMWVVTVNGRELSRNAFENEARVEILIGVLKGLYHDMEIMALIHAGAVAFGDSAALLPAASGGGKSTLTAGLVRAGARYLSDDISPIDMKNGLVFPFPLGLSLRSGSWGLLSDTFCELDIVPPLESPEDDMVKVIPVSPSRTELRPLRVSAMVFPTYGKGLNDTMNKLSLTEAMAYLSHAGFWVPLKGDHIPRFIDWMRSIRCYRLEYSSMEHAAELVNRAVL